MSPRLVLADASPLLEEERDAGGVILVAKTSNPRRVHRPGIRTTFATYDRPIDPAQVDSSDVLEQWLDGQKANPRLRRSEDTDSWDTVLLVLNTDTPPDVWLPSSFAERRTEERSHPVRALGEHLIDMPVGLQHHGSDRCNIGVRNALVKQIAHGIHEDHARRSPAQGFIQLLGDEPKVEPLLERMTGDAAKAFCERFGVTVGTSGANLRAASNGIPGRIRPLDLRVVTHRMSPESQHFAAL